MRFIALSVLFVLTACMPATSDQTTSAAHKRKSQGLVYNGFVRNCPLMPEQAAFELKPFPIKDRDLSSERLVTAVKPVYPGCAELMRIAGTVDFQFILQPDGSVTAIKLLQEVPIGFGFADTANAVFGQWKFKPRIVDGKAVASTEYYRFTWKF
jgi:outer membrane biosynthesis protein TonB